MLLGDVASVAAASHASNTPQQVGHSKPPLSRRPRPLSRAPKQRERDVPDVDWDGALQHFSVCVSQDLQDLNERFVKENVITFTAWKRLWREMNTSAAFHVEFWESTPTSTHKTILQQALDGLVSCIEQNGEFEDADDVASLIGRVFAIYCAYSLQLGVPKHKIDVDPEAWTALLSINCVMIGVGVTLFPSAVREVRAMMHRLAFQENAFLGCLQGFGSSVRVTDRLAVSRERSRTHQDSLPASSTQDTPVQRVDVEQLKILSDRYQELMSRSRSTAALASNSSIRVDGRRGKTDTPGSSLPARSLPQREDNGSQELAHALASYLTYKANEESRKADRAARVVAARDVESRNVLDLVFSERDDSSIASVSPSLMSASVSPRLRGTNRRRGSGDSECLLAELESELHANISNDTAQPSVSLVESTQRQDNCSSVLSQVSQADSDGFADLQAELEQSIEIEASQKENAPAILDVPSIDCRKGAQSSHAIPPPSKPAHTRKQPSQNIVGHPRNECSPRAAKRTRSVSITSRLSVNSWAICSTADSDGLADLQAELDSDPFLTAQVDAETPAITSSSAITGQQCASKGREIPTKSFPPPAKANKPAIQKRQAAGCSVATKRTSQRQHVRAVPQREELRGRSLSVVSDSSDLIAELQTELNLSAAPLALVAFGTLAGVHTATTVNQTRIRRSSRLSSVVSDSGSNALDELEKELSCTASVLANVRATETTSNVIPKRMTTAQKCTPLWASRPKHPAQQAKTAPSKAKKMRLNDGVEEKPTAEATKYGPGLQMRSNACGRTRVSQTEKFSDTESDRLSELVTELDSSVAPTYTVVTRASRSSLALSRVESRETVAALSGVRKSAHLNSLASDTESNGLEDLLAELERTPPVPALAPPPANKRKPTKRVGAKQPKKAINTGASLTARKLRAVRQTQVIRTRTPSQGVRPALQSSTVSVNLLSARRSTRSSSDGLAELEAELQTRTG